MTVYCSNLTTDENHAKINGADGWMHTETDGQIAI